MSTCQQENAGGLEEENAQLWEKLDSLTEELESLTEELKSEKAARREAEAKVKTQSEVIEKLEKKEKAHVDAINSLQKKIAELKRLLNAYDNPHTPSSKKLKGGKKKKKGKGKNKNDNGKNKNGKGKNGKKRRRTNRGKKIPTKPKVDRIEQRTLETCPICGSDDLCHVRTTYRIITNDHADEKPETETVGFVVEEFDCNPCGKTVANDADLPKKGSYSKSILNHVARGFRNRTTFRLIAETLSPGVKMSAMTVLHIMMNIGHALQAPADEILERIRAANVLHADETSYRFNGVNYWVWVFLDPKTGERYYKIADSRGQGPVNEVLGENWTGTIVCDGWSAYRDLRRQRCWAHILREPREAAKKGVKGAAHLHKILSRIHRDGKRASRTNKGSEWRAKQAEKLTARVKRAVETSRRIPELDSFTTKLENAIPDLFRYVTNRNIPSTNNAAERGLREIVVHRKVRGGARSNDTAIWMANFFTCVLTWEWQGKTVGEIVKYV